MDNITENEHTIIYFNHRESSSYTESIMDGQSPRQEEERMVEGGGNQCCQSLTGGLIQNLVEEEKGKEHELEMITDT